MTASSTEPPGPDAPPEHGTVPLPTLRSLLATGVGEALEVVTAPAGTGVPVRGVGVFDAGETFAAPGRLLVAVGVDTSSPQAPLVLRAAAQAGAAALVMRRGPSGPGPQLLAAAAEVGTALLTRASWIEWTELIGLLRAGLGCSGGTGGGEPPADVPPGDLFALANAFAALVGAAITIEDPDLQVLAFSRTESGADPLRRLTILGLQVPRWRLAELTASGFLRTLWTTDDVVHRPADGRFPERLAVAVRAGDEVLGSIWAAADGAPLHPDARRALRQAARAAVPHLLHHRLRAGTGSSRRRQALQSLLDGTPDVLSAAATLGLSPQTPCAVLTVAVADDPAAPGTDHGRALHLAALQAAAHRSAGLALRTEDRLDVLLPLPDEGRAPAPPEGGRPAGTGRPPREEAAARARRLAVELAATVRGAGRRPLVAVGGVRPELAEAPASRRSAHLVLRVLRGRRAGSLPEVAGEDDVRSALDALRVADAVAGLSPAVDGPVREVLAHDAKYRTDLARTLAVFLTRFGDVSGASRQLGVHPNTLRYRLRRLRTLFGLELDDPDVRLLAELGLRAAGLMPALPEAPPAAGQG